MLLKHKKAGGGGRRQERTELCAAGRTYWGTGARPLGPDHCGSMRNKRQMFYMDFRGLANRVVGWGPCRSC